MIQIDTNPLPDMATVLPTTAMAASWAKLVDPTSRMPTPQQRQDALATFYRTQSSANILLEALGARSTLLNGMPDIAAPLVPHTKIICVDTESSTHNTDLLTEVGLSMFKRSHGRTVAANPGSYGVKIMEQLSYLHFRVVEHAHLLSNREGSLGPLGNRFGHTRFTSFAELRVILHHLFNERIQSADPGLKGCMCPVILVGHALKHDIENGSKQGLDYNFAANSTIVARVDTQQLARDVGVWIPPPDMRTNEIGLRVLIQEKVGFLHLDDHTACNDAARTLICGIWMIVPPALKQGQSRTMQDVANRLEKLSQRDEQRSPNPYGTVECCTRCGARDHSLSNCTATAVQCAACERFHDVADAAEDKAARAHMVGSHIEQYCPHVARWKAWFRRYRDAWLKNRASGKPFSAEILAGPGSDAHPFSTWRKVSRPHWPLGSLDEALEGMAMSVEPNSGVCNLQAALGGFPVPDGGSWVLKTSMLSTSGAATTATTTNARADPAAAAAAANDAAVDASSSALPPTDDGLLAPGDFPVLTTAFSGLSLLTTNDSTPTPIPTSITSATPTPTAKREVKMSDMRGRGRSDRARGDGGGTKGLSIPSREIRGNSTKGASASGVWDAWND